ncbi:MAG: tetratricopeptide repeat protein [Candidatus Brocadiae bacterium]|nr:tetratricopeptide repeat protein [Candidatus Brocadiia bacterium]
MDVSKLYSKVEEALKKKNYDYAIETLKNQILKFNPNDVKARKLLRATVLEKYKNESPPTASQVWSKGFAPRVKMLFGKISKKWDVVIDEAENFLQYDPKNLSVLCGLGEACTEAGYIDTAISVFENILAFDSSHVPALKSLGRIYRFQKEDLEKAKYYYQRAVKLAPQDNEVSKMVKDLSAQITADTYGQAKSSHDLIKDQEKAKDLEEDNTMLRTEEDYARAIERTAKKLETDPNNRRELKRLGELYQKTGKFDKALEIYNKILEMDPTNSDLKNRIGECRLQKVERQIQTVKDKLDQDPQNESLKQEYKKMLRAKVETEIQEYTNQVKDQPTNFEFRFKLGLSLFQASRFDEALAQFQVAVKDPRKKISAYTYMGQAFLQKKEYDLAIEQFQNALNAQTTKERQYKDTLYHLALAFESAGRTQDAIETYTTIYKEDINFKDVQARLKKLKS